MGPILDVRRSHRGRKAERVLRWRGKWSWSRCSSGTIEKLVGPGTRECPQSLTRAGEWVEREAIRYRAAVNVSVANTYFVFDDDSPDEVAVGFGWEGSDVGPLEQNATEKALIALSRAADDLRFRDAVALLPPVNSRLRADSSVWFMHHRRAGRSFAVPREFSALTEVKPALATLGSRPSPSPWRDLQG